MSNTKREAAYDKEIHPLMAQILQACKDNDIPMIASFQLNDDREGLSDTNADGEDLGAFFCTSILTGRGAHPGADGMWAHTHQKLLDAGAALRPDPPPSWAAYTVTDAGSERVAGSDDGYDPGRGRRLGVPEDA